MRQSIKILQLPINYLPNESCGTRTNGRCIIIRCNLFEKLLCYITYSDVQSVCVIIDGTFKSSVKKKMIKQRPLV